LKKVVDIETKMLYFKDNADADQTTV